MIVRDEHALLAQAIASVDGLADEIVVVDTGSTDDTVEIARRLGARVFREPWTDDFAAARNASLDHATGDWILVLDADQEIDGSSHDEIRRLCHTQTPVGYLLRQLNYTDAAGYESYLEHLIVRLFPRHSAIRYSGRVHEQLVATDPTLGLQLVTCGAIIHHHGYRPQWRPAKHSAQRDRSILEDQTAADPHDPFLAYNLGVTYQVLGQLVDAERALRRAIELAHAKWPHAGLPGYVPHAYLLLVQLALRDGRNDEAVVLARAGLAVDPRSPDLHAALGDIYLSGGRVDDAIDEYERARSMTSSSGAPTDRALASWKARLGIAEAQLQAGRWYDALVTLDDAAKAAPGNAQVVLAAARAWRGLGRLELAGECLRRLTLAPDAPPAAWLSLADIRLQQTRRDEARAVLVEGCERHGDDRDLLGRLDAIDVHPPA